MYSGTGRPLGGGTGGPGWLLEGAPGAWDTTIGYIRQTITCSHTPAAAITDNSTNDTFEKGTKKGFQNVYT